MSASDDDEKAIFAAVDFFMESVAANKLEETLAAFSGDPDCALIGSEVGGEALGPAALEAFSSGCSHGHRPSQSPGDLAAHQ